MGHRRVRHAALAVLVAATGSTVVSSGAVTAAPSSTQWESIDAPAANTTSRYQQVETAPDGSIYVAGWHRFTESGVSPVFETIVRKYDSSGGLEWTSPIGGLWSTEPDIPDMVVDGLGNPYLKLCRSTCTLTVFDPATGHELRSISDDGIHNFSPPIGVKAGGVLVVNRGVGAPTTLAARRLSVGLDESWSFDLNGKLDVDAIAWLVEEPSGSFWAIGHKPGSDEEMRMVHFDGAGGALGDPSHTPEARRSTPRGRPDERAPFHVVPATAFGSWSTLPAPICSTSGSRRSHSRPADGSETSIATRRMSRCRTSQGTHSACSRTRPCCSEVCSMVRTRPHGSSSACWGRGSPRSCTALPLGGGAAVAMMVVYTTSSLLGGSWVRVGQLPFPTDTTVSDVAVDATGGLVFAGFTAAASPEAWFLVPPGPTNGSAAGPRAALARNPTGSVNAEFHSLTPGRLFDTRPSEPNGLVGVPKARLTPSSDLRVRVGGLGGVPTNGAAAVTLNVTNPQASGFVTAYPCGGLPLASNLNFVTGQTIANAVIAPVSASGEVCFHANVETDLLADVNGWFHEGGSFHPLAPRARFRHPPERA